MSDNRGNNRLDSSVLECDYSFLDLMKWTKPATSRNQVNKAGKIIASRQAPDDVMTWDDAINTAANWRSSHGYPLQVMGMTLRRRALSIDPEAIVAQRIKRLPSIKGKLERFRNMQLSQMQDLGGCRAVVKDIQAVGQLARIYADQPLNAAVFCEKYDYIANPKPDGYRGVHLVYEYRAANERHALYNRMRIEVQLRSRLQHSWATALEVIDVFTKQALKSGIGDARWKRFFLLASNLMSAIELGPDPATTPKTKEERKEMLQEFKNLCHELHVIDRLTGIGAGLTASRKTKTTCAVYILILDSQERSTRVKGYDSEEEASLAYRDIEKDILIHNPNMQAVMVSVDSINGLRKAYPNYFLDTKDLVEIIHSVGLALDRIEDIESGKVAPPRKKSATQKGPPKE